MKKRIIILMSCFVMMLSGCALFPLRKDEQPLIRSEKEDTTVSQIETTTEVPVEEEEAERTGEVVKPADIEESEEVAGDLVYCISPVNIRAAGESGAPVIGAMRTGDIATKMSQEGGWVEIMFEGQHGYVYTDFVSETPPN